MEACRRIRARWIRLTTETDRDCAAFVYRPVIAQGRRWRDVIDGDARRVLCDAAILILNLALHRARAVAAQRGAAARI